MIKQYFKKIKFKFIGIYRSAGFVNKFTELAHKHYLNHKKIIHSRNGFPVYSLTLPALYSGPAANYFSQLMFSVVQNRRLPKLMSFAVNDECNAKCDHCSFFGEADDKCRKVLTTEQSKKVIKDAQELGVSVINFVGGEPLMRKDIFELIKSVDKELSTTLLFTNGSDLFKKALDLKKAGLDSVYVSIDSADKEKHENKRGVRGIFDKAISGLKEAKRVGLSVGISCCLSKEDFEAGELDRLIELGKKDGIHEVMVFDKIPSGRLKNAKNLNNSLWVNDMIKSTEKYNKNNDYPGILVYAYTASYRGVGCSGGTSYFYVSPYGDISPCDFNHATYGNVLETPLYRIWDEISSTADFNKTSWNGCRMRNK